MSDLLVLGNSLNLPARVTFKHEYVGTIDHGIEPGTYTVLDRRGKTETFNQWVNAVLYFTKFHWPSVCTPLAYVPSRVSYEPYLCPPLQHKRWSLI
jgi:hypothetical protein